MAAPNGDITVTGATTTTIELTIATAAVDFGTSMSPDGTGNEVNASYTDTAGACFWWDGTNNLTVRSNVAYDLAASVGESANPAPQLFFSETASNSYADCLTGAPANNGPLGSMASGAPFTTGDLYATHLALVAPWASDLFKVSTTLTFQATAS